MALQKAPGIEDIFPDRINKWNKIINSAKNIFGNYNYKEIVLPILEYTEVFARGIGDETDIVSKEMFTFEDRGGRSLTLRPEGTASVVRAYCENGEYNRLSSCKFFYVGPMFRAEKPQRGRLRQFNQFGAELFGSDNPFHDYEVIAMMDSITQELNIKNYSLLINSIGCDECRPEYINKLQKYYTNKKEELCDDCKRRLDKNPLRLLDCKKESCQKLKEDSPKITSFLCEDCDSHYSEVKKHLTSNNIKYTEDHFLVRGLDYYNKTTFEFVTNELGGQNAFAAGGRYNKLVETFGGKSTPAVGFAAGIERIYLLIEKQEIAESSLDAFLVYAGEGTGNKALEILSNLRKNNISADIDPTGKGFKAQMKKVDRENAKFAIIIGENELKNEFATIKKMQDGNQESISFNKIVDFINSNQ